MSTATAKAGLEKLREPFAPAQVGKLPKPYNKDAQKGNCRECGGYHGLPAMHLDYVGHAALTDRFLSVDPEWSWEPVSFGPDGLPAFDKLGGLWIRLTICGVTRLGYGDAGGKTGNNAVKEAIGDALRNAGMRFGAALDLWHKGDLHDVAEESAPPAPRQAVDVAAFDPTPFQAKISAASTVSELVAVGDDIATANFFADDADLLRAEYKQRLAELKGTVASPDSAGYDPMGLDGGDR